MLELQKHAQIHVCSIANAKRVARVEDIHRFNIF